MTFDKRFPEGMSNALHLKEFYDPIVPRISVVIPTCDRDDALALCLDRLAPGAQTLDAKEYEVIVTDDGARLTTEAMLRKHYPWARWTRGPRRGPAANRNHGASQARGEWVAFTDDDCLPEPRWLQAYADAMAAGDQTDVLEGKTISSEPLRGPLMIAPQNLEGGCGWSCNLMVRAATFREMGGFDEGFPHAADEDTDFHERLQGAHRAMRFVSEAVIVHPPVRRPWGRRSARLWESKVRLGYKRDAHRAPFTRRELVWNALRTRGRQLTAASRGWDTLVAAAGLPIELLWISRHAARWDRKHRRDLAARAESTGSRASCSQ